DTGDGHGSTEYLWRQMIDMNGDGRLDIVDALEEPGHWVVYLNTPTGVPGLINWVKKSIDVTSLQAALTARGFAFNNGYMDLRRQHTGQEWSETTCLRSNGRIYVDVVGGANCPPPVRTLGLKRTFVEWELRDMNGDGYPDFVFDHQALYDGPVFEGFAVSS